MRTAHTLLIVMTAVALALASPAAAETTGVPTGAPETGQLEPAAPQTGELPPAAPQTGEVQPAGPKTVDVLPAAPETVELQPPDGAPEPAGAVAPAPQPAAEAETTPPPRINASDTRQVIWQTQVGCVTRCVNTSQTQQASQVSSTSQSGAGQQVSHTQQEVRQTQVGCPALCLGDDADVQAVYEAVLAAIRHDLPTGPLGQRLMDEVTSLLAAALSPEPSAPTSTQEEGADRLLDDTGVAVAQAIEQVQAGCVVHCRATSQEQRASQETLISQAAGGFASVLQFIWQLQIGCIAFCEDTVQVQEAAQESHVIQGGQRGVPPGPPPPPTPPDSGAAPGPPATISVADTGEPSASPTAQVGPAIAAQPPAAMPAEPRSSGGRRRPPSAAAAPPRVAPRRQRHRVARQHQRRKYTRALPVAAPLVAGPGARRFSTSGASAAFVDPAFIGAALPRLVPLQSLDHDTASVLADLLAVLAFALIGGAAAAGVSGARRRRF